METATASLCPDPEALAAFVDQGLRADETTQIEAHLGECDTCRLIVARVFDTKSAVLAADPAAFMPGQRSGRTTRLVRFRRAHVVLGAGSLLTAAAVLTLMFDVGDRSKLADLAEAVGDDRTVEARLTGGFHYGHVRAPVRSGGSSVASSDDWTIFAAAGKIREDAQRDPSAPNLHALGVAHLVVGEYDEAVRAIEDAIAEDPEPPQYHSDLAAAYLARAKHLDRPDDLPRALGAAARAIQGNDKLIEARFNRALALEALFLDDQARQAWEDYLLRDSPSGWASEARDHLQKLQQRAAPQDGARNNSPPPITDTSVEPALDWLLRQGLPAWADAILAGDSQQAALHSSQLSSYAQQIAERNGDPLPIGLAVMTRADSAHATALAIREFAVARDLLRGPNAAKFDGQMLRLCSSRQDFLGALCQLEMAGQDFLRRQDDVGRVHLEAVEKISAPSPYLEGRRQLLFGYRPMVTSRYQAAIESYEPAFRSFSSAKYLSLAGNSASQLADMFELLGLVVQAWQWRQRSLQICAAVGDPNLKYISHLAIAEGLERVGNLSAANAFMASFNAPMFDGLSEFLRARLEISRGRLALALGDSDTARASFQRADRIINSPLDFRTHRMKADLLMLRAALEHRDRELDSARLTLEEAMAAMGAERLPQRTAALVLYADISTQQPHWHASAERALAEAARLVSSRTAGSEPVRREDLKRAFDTVATLVASDPSLQGLRGLHLIEQLREAVEGVPPTRGLPELADFERAVNTVSAGGALIVFSVTEQSLLKWIIADGRIQFLKRDLPSAEIAALANTLAIQLHRAPEQENVWRTTLGRLYDLAFGDVPAIRAARDVVVVPDGPLHRVPFGALFDAESGQYVFERSAVRVASNIAFARPDPPGQPAALKATIIGDPQVSGSNLFPPLVAARREAAEVAKLYSTPTMVVGSDATKHRVLETMTSADVVHFAGHAIAGPSISRPRLLLAGNPTDVTTGLSATDLDGTIKGGTRVVLAGCETGATRLDRVESLTSISSAFLRAGAGSVVAALWPLNDTSGAAFFPLVHRELVNGQRTSAAVARAQRACRANPSCRRSASTWIGTIVYGHQ
jgi:CHAT domain-containing protein